MDQQFAEVKTKNESKDLIHTKPSRFLFVFTERVSHKPFST